MSFTQTHTVVYTEVGLHEHINMKAPSTLHINPLSAHTNLRRRHVLHPINLPLHPIRLPRPRRIQGPITRIRTQPFPPSRRPALRRLQPRALERLLKVMYDIRNMLQAQANTDQIRRHATLDLLLVGDLLVRRAPRMNDQRLCIPDVRQMRAEFEVVHHGGDFGDVACDAEGEHASLAFWQHLLREGVVGVCFEAGVVDPADVRRFLQPVRERERVGDVPVCSERERF